MWDTQDCEEIPEIAKKQYGIELRHLSWMILELMAKNDTSGSRDDVLRLLELTSRLAKISELKESMHGQRKAEIKKTVKILRSLGSKNEDKT